MTNLAKIMLFALVLGTLGIYLTSCNKSDSILDNVIEDSVQQTQTSTTENGWLYFADDAAMDATYTDLLENFKEVEAWEAKRNHNSLRARYGAAIERISNMEETNVKPEQLLKEYKDVLHIVGEGDEKETVCIVDDMVMQALLNKDGIIQIGQRISKYSKNKVKTITDGDMSKLELLEKIDRTDEALGVEVTDIGNLKRCKWSNGLTNEDTRKIVRYITVGDNRRVKFKTTIDKRNNGELRFYHEMNSQFRNWFFGWANNNFSYSYRIVGDYHIVDKNVFPPQIIADSDYEYGWKNDSGLGEEYHSLTYINPNDADLEIYYFFRLQAAKNIAGTEDIPVWGEQAIWTYKCD